MNSKWIFIYLTGLITALFSELIYIFLEDSKSPGSWLLEVDRFTQLRFNPNKLRGDKNLQRRTFHRPSISKSASAVKFTGPKLF